MDMKMKPIEIDIESLKIFARITFILDQTHLIKDIYKIRKSWNLGEDDLIPYEDFDEWYKNNWGDLSLTEDTIYYLSTAKDQLEIQTGQDRLDEIEEFQRKKELAYLNRNDFELDYLLKKNGLKNPSLKSFILKAIVCGEVKENDWQKVQNSQNTSFSRDWLLDDPKFYASLEKIYEDEKDKEDKKSKKKRGRGKDKIKRDRQWYFMWLNKKDQDIGVYGRIWEDWNKQCTTPDIELHEKCKHCIFDVNIIEQAISRYCKFLQS